MRTRRRHCGGRRWLRSSRITTPRRPACLVSVDPSLVVADRGSHLLPSVDGTESDFALTVVSVGGGAVANCGDGRQDEARAAPRSPRGWGDRAMLWLTAPTPKTMTRAWPAVYQCGRSGTKRIHRPPCAFSLRYSRNGMTNTHNHCLDRSQSQKLAFLTHRGKLVLWWLRK